MEQASSDDAAAATVAPHRRDSVSREERKSVSTRLTSNGEGAGSRKRPRPNPDDDDDDNVHYNGGTRSINAAATSSKSPASETTTAELLLLEDEWARFARKCTESREEQIMHRIKEEVRREKRKMEATPEWDRAVAEVQQLEYRFHKLWLQWARDEEARRLDEAYRARRAYFAGQRTPLPATLPHAEKRQEEDRRPSDRELLRPVHRSGLQDEDERRRSRDRGTSRTSAREQPEPSARRPRSRSLSQGRRTMEDSPPDDEMHLRKEQRSQQQQQQQQRERDSLLEDQQRQRLAEQEEESARRVAREVHEQERKQKEQEEEAEETDEAPEQALPDAGSLPRPPRAARFRHRCEMCQVTLNSQKQMFEHFRGKKHVQAEERLRKLSGQGPSPATYPPSGQALNWQNQRDWRADDEMNWEREKARGWSKLPTSPPPPPPPPPIVKSEPRDRRAHEVSTGTELVQATCHSVVIKQDPHVMRDGGQAATEAERERPARFELDLNVASDEEEAAKIKQEEAAPRPTRERLGPSKVVNLFGVQMLITDDDDDGEGGSSDEDREGDSEGSGSNEDDGDEDSDAEHGEEPEAEAEGEEEEEDDDDDEGEATEVYCYTDEEEEQDEDEEQEAEEEEEEDYAEKEEERREESAIVELENAKEERRKLLERLRRASGASDEAETTTTSTTSSSQPRKPGFLLSLTQRRKNWEAKYALVKEWFDTHGRLPSKGTDRTLYNWLFYYKRSWSMLDRSQAARLRALGVKPFRPKSTMATAPSSQAKEEAKPEPRRRVRLGADSALWEAQLRELERFRVATNGQNPPYFIPIGKWLYEQIALQNRGLLGSSRQSRLEGLGIKWDWKDEPAKSGREKAEPTAATEDTKKKKKKKKRKRRAERTQDGSDTEEKKGSAKKKEREKEKGKGKKKEKEKEKATSKRTRKAEERAKKNPKKRRKKGAKEEERKSHTKVPWEVRYEELCQYLAAHDHQLPGTQTTLGKWLYTQRYRINKGLQTQEDKIAKLVALGVTLSPKIPTTLAATTMTTPTTTTMTTPTTTTTTPAAAGLPEPDLGHPQWDKEDEQSTVSATMQELLQRIKEEKL